MGLEGIVSKRRTSRYRSGPSKAWLKAKCFYEEELTVIGTERGHKAPVALLARETSEGL
jgi:ATP-dependent DNA ligase